jgi:hypothetical protein
MIFRVIGLYDHLRQFPDIRHTLISLANPMQIAISTFAFHFPALQSNLRIHLNIDIIHDQHIFVSVPCFLICASLSMHFLSIICITLQERILP